MKKPQSVDAQKVKENLLATANKIGKRKRITAAQLFQIVIDCCAS